MHFKGPRRQLASLSLITELVEVYDAPDSNFSDFSDRRTQTKIDDGICNKTSVSVVASKGVDVSLLQRPV